MDAWERNGSFDADDTVAALEGHHYDNILGDDAYWRECDHQAADPP
jgi:hypothetical protein